MLGSSNLPKARLGIVLHRHWLPTIHQEAIEFVAIAPLRSRISIAAALQVIQVKLVAISQRLKGCIIILNWARVRSGVSVVGEIRVVGRDTIMDRKGNIETIGGSFDRVGGLGKGKN
jgi:hypothetical protein